RRPARIGSTMRDRLLRRACFPCLLAAAVLTLAASARAQGTSGAGILELAPAQFELAGLHRGRQLLVTLVDGARGPRDVTRQARYAVEPRGVVRVSAQGYVRPVGTGTATITVEAAGQKRQVNVHV